MSVVGDVEKAAGMWPHLQTFAFAGLALIAGLGAGALYFYDKGYAAAEVKSATAIAEANAKAEAARASLQQSLATASAARDPAIESKLADIATKLRAVPLKPPGAPAPASCKADQARVAWADSTR